MKALLLFLLLLPFLAFSQITITGKIIDVGNKPVVNANVFLSNALVGAHTNADGTFKLQNVKPGQYDMVVSFIGYQTHHQNLMVKTDDILVPTIVLLVKSNELKAVNIGPPDANRSKYLELFKREFLGRSANAQNCKITNLDILDIAYHKNEQTLTAGTDDFLIIENKALGYTIHYQLTNFQIKFDAMQVGTYATYYDGNTYFENMPGSASQQKKWDKARLEAYRGSSMHFLRSIIANKLDGEGFKVLRLIRKPNPARPDDSLIRAKVAQFSTMPKGINNLDFKMSDYSSSSDSATYWRQKFNMPKTLEFLVSKPLEPADYVARIDDKNIYSLKFTDFLYITYPKPAGSGTDQLARHYNTADNDNVTIVTINRKFAIFDQNGIFADPTSTTFEGAWSKNGTADLLPVDYEPVVK